MKALLRIGGSAVMAVGLVGVATAVSTWWLVLAVMAFSVGLNLWHEGTR